MKKAAIAIPIVILALALFLFLAIRGHWDSWTSDATVQSTNDAYVAADQIPLSTRISSTVKAVPVQDFQAVKAGDTIVELESTDYSATVDEAQAGINAAHAQLTANQDAKRASDAGIEAAKQAVDQAVAGTVTAQSAVSVQEAQLTQAESEYQRQSKLLQNVAATRQQFEQAQAARNSARAALEGRRADLARATAAVSASRAALAGALQQRASLNATDALLKAQITAKEAGKAISKVNLGYAKIVAPADGRIGKMKVHPGQLVGAGVQVVDFVQNGAWVEANLLETQLAHVRAGNKAEVKIDAYPSQPLDGHVLYIAPASGAASSILPPDNATGNFTKVIQRVPVKIVIDSKVAPDLLRPGLSAEVHIHTDSK